MNKLMVYMDETGRTGIHRYTDERWNFFEHPLFGLGALYIPSYNVEDLKAELDVLIDSKHYQAEFKWSNKEVRRDIDDLLLKLVNIVKKHGGNFHFEIEEKHFSVAKIITDYCVVPFYSLSEDQLNSKTTILIKRAFANYINFLPDSLLGEICAFFDSGVHDISKLKFLINKIIKEIEIDAIKNNCRETIDFIEENERAGFLLNKSLFFPIADLYKCSGSYNSVSVDPHTDSFTHLLQMSLDKYRSADCIICKHDVQDQWKPALEDAAKRLNVFVNRDIFSVDFISGYNVIVNTVDCIVGYLCSCLTDALLYNKEIPTNIRKICNSSLTLVSSLSFQRRILSENNEMLLLLKIFDSLKQTGKVRYYN